MRCPWLLALPLVLSSAVRAEDRKAEPADLVTVQKGKLPIVLSAPHGGQSELPGVPPRRGEGLPKGSGSGFFTARDVNTDRLALAEAAEK